MIGSINSSLVSTWEDSLFTKLDTKNQGYIDKDELSSAFSTILDNSDSATTVDDTFTQLDSNSDGKITKDELAAGMQSLLAQMGSMPPPPPPEGQDTGFTKDELASQLSAIGSSDSKRSALISNIIENFDKADTDGDSKVTFKEAMAYDQANQTSTSTTADSSATVSATDSQSSEAGVMTELMKLMQAYQVFGDNSNQSDVTGLSVTA